MLILNADAAEEQQEEIIERVRQLVVDGGGEVDHVNDWGPRKITYPMNKQSNGRYVVVTCSAESESLDEIGRVLAISKDVALRSMFHRLGPADAERAKANGAPLPVDDRPEGEQRSRRDGRDGRDGRGGGRRHR
jgi:small subunit ribosomal protein S6